MEVKIVRYFSIYPIFLCLGWASDLFIARLHSQGQCMRVREVCGISRTVSLCEMSSEWETWELLSRLFQYKATHNISSACYWLENVTYLILIQTDTQSLMKCNGITPFIILDGVSLKTVSGLVTLHGERRKLWKNTEKWAVTFSFLNFGNKFRSTVSII